MPSRAEAESVLRAIVTQHWRLNYYDFIGLLGLSDDAYAQEKWQHFQNLVRALNNLSDATVRIVEAYDGGQT